jgi:hypothetical protein
VQGYLCTLNSLEKHIHGLLLFGSGCDPTSSQFSDKLTIADGLTAIEIELMEQKLKLFRIDFKLEPFECLVKLVFGEGAIRALIYFLKATNQRNVTRIEKFNHPIKDIGVHPVIEIN